MAAVMGAVMGAVAVRRSAAPVAAHGYSGLITFNIQTAAAMAQDTNNADALRRILQSSRSVAIVGLSAEWHRPSFFVAKYLQQHGFRILPVNPRYAGSQILGMACVARLEDITEPVAIALSAIGATSSV